MSQRRPRILCMIETVGKGGGAEQLLASLLPEMRRQGAHVEVAALFDWPEDLGAELQREGVPVHRLHLSGPSALLDAVRKLRRLGRERQPDIFWGHLYYGNAFAWLARWLAGRGALVVTLHSESFLSSPPASARGKLAVALERQVLQAANYRVAVSAALRADYTSFFDCADMAVVHNGVDCDRLAAVIPADPAAVRAAFGYTADEFLIVTPARYIPKKGHAVLLDAIETLRVAHEFAPKVLLCGVGPLLEPIRADVAARGMSDQLTIAPVIPHERLLPLIAAADAVVLPSLYESFGIAAAEAMALGTPCVLSDVDGFRELTAGADCALMVPPGDAKALAAAIYRLDSEPLLRADLGKRGQDHVCGVYGITACARRWIGILEGQGGFRSN
jgi:glycosyltransferase involved in cell wall biosynthesis